MVNLMAALEDIIEDGLIGNEVWLNNTLSKVTASAVNLRMETTAIAHGVSQWDMIDSKRITDAFISFEESRLSRTMLRNFGGKWQHDLAMRWDDTVNRIQFEFTEAVALGRPNNELAGLIQDEMGQVFQTGGMNKEAYSRAFVRTKFNEISNRTSLGLAAEAGLDNLINMGVPDDRQSVVCAEAANQKPMTRAEWEQSEWGLPPRHVMNCRCEMIAIPDDAVEDEWRQDSGETDND